MHNCLVGAIRDKKVLPKFIVIVLDDDLISFVKHKLGHKLMQNDQLVKAAFDRILRWLMSQYSRLIATQKEYLPNRAKRENQPNVIWIEPPMHDAFQNNQLHLLFGRSLEKIVSFQEKNFSLQLKKSWDPRNRALFNAEDHRYTTLGFETYWDAVDKAIKFADTLLLKKEALKKAKQQQTFCFPKKDQFHWSR